MGRKGERKIKFIPCTFKFKLLMLLILSLVGKEKTEVVGGVGRKGAREKGKTNIRTPL